MKKIFILILFTLQAFSITVNDCPNYIIFYGKTCHLNQAEKFYRDEPEYDYTTFWRWDTYYVSIYKDISSNFFCYYRNDDLGTWQCPYCADGYVPDPNDSTKCILDCPDGTVWDENASMCVSVPICNDTDTPFPPDDPDYIYSNSWKEC